MKIKIDCEQSDFCTKPVASVDLDVLDKLCENLKCAPNDLLAIEK